ncbi:MAG TPA: transcription antitermination factor NusB, partial [Thermoleophilia bacterium]|nr:transcription antitermination factor NusB [Thermoleophilia bacterium]
PSRKQARRDAAFVLYQHEVTGAPVDRLLADRARSEGYQVDEFTRRMVVGVLADRGELDDELAANSPSWPLARIAPLERSILRLSLFEISSGETPPEVAIDEAVRLAKRYSTDEAGALVNGILAGVLRGRSAPSDDEAGGGREAAG